MTEYNTEELAKLDRAHLLHGNTNLYDYYVNGKSSVVLVRGEGSLVYDSNGKEYIDGFAGLWNVNVGHGRKEITRAVAEQMDAIPYTPTILGLSNVPATQLAAKLATIAPEGISHFYFACGGAEANEVAFKVARYLNSVLNRKDRIKIVSRQMGYHGLATATMWATALPQFWRNFGPQSPGFVRIPAPYCYRCAYGKVYGQCDLDCATALEAVIQTEDENTIAAFIGEPVIGTGGVIVPPKEYWPMIRETCTKYDVLLIADEVITGFGRTGTLWGVQQWGIKPDMMTMAKGITSAYQPLAALGIAEDVFRKMLVPGHAFMHSYTYSGHPVVCAAALANIAIIERENLVAYAAEMGAYMNLRLAELNDLPWVGETRGLGLMAAVELVADKRTKRKFAPELGVGPHIMAHTKEKGVICRASDDWIALSPPLIVTKDQIDVMVEAVRSAIITIKA